MTLTSIFRSYGQNETLISSIRNIIKVCSYIYLSFIIVFFKINFIAFVRIIPLKAYSKNSFRMVGINFTMIYNTLMTFEFLTIRFKSITFAFLYFMNDS